MFVNYDGYSGDNVKCECVWMYGGGGYLKYIFWIMIGSLKYDNKFRFYVDGMEEVL